MILNSLSQNLIETLFNALPEDCLRRAEPRYLEEPRSRYRGNNASYVALPRTVDEVATIVRACNTAGVGIVPYGGGTGLVGGQVLDQGPVPLILSLERMNKIRAVHPLENVLVAEAGAILASVQDAAEEVGRLFPLSLAAEGSATIGGNLSTNAGGVNVLRYGNTRDLCLGLEAVLPSGEIWHGLTRLRKDNTGYDLRNLLIGAEGSLGIITAAALKMAPRPASYGTAFMAVNGPDAALQLLALARSHVGESVSAFELIHRQGPLFVAETLPDVRQPFVDPPEWMVLVEFGMPAGADSALEMVFEVALEKNLVNDGVIAQSAGQRADFWSLREHIPEANKRIGSISSHDISLPLSAVSEFIIVANSALADLGEFRINCFGHLGDGNLHFNVFPPKGQDREDFVHLRDAVKNCVHKLLQGFEGSFSAEHGVGRMKVEDLEKYGDPTRLIAMRSIKTALDPNGIMNPGAVLRA
ncbi:FAD/FMN-containing dehydrogenase [Shimia gijangensis]|uniref:FAD/FMN-containing dehydrogenase n=1 Tax=Shimia gijangensis TaxID=1470563 RepID=A0A1M6P672_9RHOB|nr:FAD-binding oxidoreductase [Shimia gijangensis]SHK03392.1 FAD/FMN-containing dehydrogenase [Shimia gijangensis]